MTPTLSADNFFFSGELVGSNWLVGKQNYLKKESRKENYLEQKCVSKKENYLEKKYVPKKVLSLSIHVNCWKQFFKFTYVIAQWTFRFTFWKKVLILIYLWGIYGNARRRWGALIRPLGSPFEEDLEKAFEPDPILF